MIFYIVGDSFVDFFYKRRRPEHRELSDFSEEARMEIYELLLKLNAKDLQKSK